MTACTMKQYSNDIRDHEAAVAWRTAALADGWTMESVYKTEPMESYARIRKEGYSGHVCARVTEEMKARYSHYVSKWKYNSEISLWGPDNLAIEAPAVYSWDAITQGTKTCSECGKTNVETTRVAFANRVCLSCLPASRAKHEVGNWTE